MTPETAQIIQDCIDGKQAAWDELVTRYGRLVYSIPIRYGLALEDAEEVFQNAFINVYRNLPRLRNQDSFTSWLITIAHRESWSVIKRIRPTAELDESISDPEAPTLEVIQRWERQDAVRHALKQLEPPCTELLTSLFLETPPPSYEQIAERLHLPVGSIGPNRRRCMKKLESILISMGIDLDG